MPFGRILEGLTFYMDLENLWVPPPPPVPTALSREMT